MNLDHRPQAHEKFRCEKCGMELEITKACMGTDHGPELRCCGADMVQGESPAGQTLTPEAHQNIYTA